MDVRTILYIYYPQDISCFTGSLPLLFMKIVIMLLALNLTQLNVFSLLLRQKNTEMWHMQRYFQPCRAILIPNKINGKFRTPPFIPSIKHSCVINSVRHNRPARHNTRSLCGCPGASSSVELNGCLFQQEQVAGTRCSSQGLHQPLDQAPSHRGLQLEEKTLRSEGQGRWEKVYDVTMR